MYRRDDIPFLRGKRNKNGELVIRKMTAINVIRGAVLPTLISGIIITRGLINSPDNPMYIVFLVVIGFLLLFLILDLSLYKVTFTNENVVLESFSGGCSMEYKDIKNVDYSKRGGGQFIIQSDNEKIVMQAGVKGIAEAMEWLHIKAGQSLCEEANAFLSNKKENMKEYE